MLFGIAFLADYLGTKCVVFRVIAVLMVIGLIVYRGQNLIHKDEQVGLFNKQQAVNYIIQQKQDKVFNVSYSIGPGYDDSGYRYLFQYAGIKPQNIPEGHLWSIVVPTNFENVPPLVSFGVIGVIRR